jgi:hypothetical protein
MGRRSLVAACVGVIVTAGALGTALAASAAPPAKPRVQPKLHLMRPRGFNGQKPGKPGGHNQSNNLYYHSGASATGVETAPQVYLVFWGSQWTGNDPVGEANVLESFLAGVGGSSWLNSVTQYCQGLQSGTYFCNGAGTPAGNPSSIFTFSNIWNDNSAAAPAQPSQSQLANEATAAAAHFGNTGSSQNASVQYVIATANGYNPPGFGTQYCAWHSSTSSKYGKIAYTNLPYIPEAGTACGAEFNLLGEDAGITIVEGHELAETITDQFPTGGWLDRQGMEIGDKCAWSGATSDQPFSTGQFPVQPLWSNAFNNQQGGCVLSYP